MMSAMIITAEHKGEEYEFAVKELCKEGRKQDHKLGGLFSASLLLNCYPIQNPIPIKVRKW